MSDIKPISLDKVKTYSLKERKSKVGINDFADLWNKGDSILKWLDSLPDILCAKDLKEIIKEMVKAVEGDKMILLGMGAHPIKVGLSPIIIDLMEKGILKGIAMNGAGIIHDSEIAMVGHTSEDVARELRDGRFGMANETGAFLNKAISEGNKKGMGLGGSVGSMLIEKGFPFNRYSILAKAFELGVPVTVHVAMGTDIIHMHPDVDPSAIGSTSHRDFRLFARLVSQLEQGVFINLGSAVIIPEVFLKALSLVRNLRYNIYRFTAINMDFISQYRSITNVVQRPTMEGGKGFNIIG
ncbi:MAG: hypothetical protein DRG39_07175, partial [Deltaproteobacteria bacterium]